LLLFELLLLLLDVLLTIVVGGLLSKKYLFTSVCGIVPTLFPKVIYKSLYPDMKVLIPPYETIKTSVPITTD
jgi:hypothetical protein